MVESDFNRIINKTFKEKYFSHKISDGMGGIAVQNPFDGFTFTGRALYWESKLIKNDHGSFNFNKLEQHQYDNLCLIKQLDRWNIADCLVFVGYWAKNNYFEFYVFDIGLIKRLKERGINSILKKQIVKLKEAGFAIQIKKESFDLDGFEKKIIWELI